MNAVRDTHLDHTLPAHDHAYIQRVAGFAVLTHLEAMREPPHTLRARERQHASHGQTATKRDRYGALV